MVVLTSTLALCEAQEGSVHRIQIAELCLGVEHYISGFLSSAGSVVCDYNESLVLCRYVK